MFTRLEKYKVPIKLANFDNLKGKSYLKIEYNVDNLEEELLIAEAVRSSKEIIFRITNKGLIFSCITIHQENDSIIYKHVLDLVPHGDTVELLSNDTLLLVGYAIMHEIPIVPNDESQSVSLALLYRKTIKMGFDYYDNDSNVNRLTFEGYEFGEKDAVKNFKFLNIARLWSPGEIALLKFDMEFDLNRLSSADNILYKIRRAIDELELLLETEDRIENKIQKCITDNPIIFGLDYLKIIPKFKLGSEYELDYALEKYNGEIDMVELEASVHKLYTQAGNPTKYLTHAEQQVMDWLDWVEKNGPYARNKLSTLITPKAYVIIGRDSSLNKEDRTKLNRRNLIFGDRITILTYDDLLFKAQNMLAILESE